MTSTRDERSWAEHAEVFLGRIHILEDSAQVVSDPEQSTKALYLSHFQDNAGEVISGQSDWVITGTEAPAYPFRFLFHSKSPDRLHFMVTGSGADHEKKLGISRNGYLGLYKVASASDYFKLEVLSVGQGLLLCHLRDHQGHRVKTWHSPDVESPRFSYMNVQKGSQVKFLIERVSD